MRVLFEVADHEARSRFAMSQPSMGEEEVLDALELEPVVRIDRTFEPLALGEAAGYSTSLRSYTAEAVEPPPSTYLVRGELGGDDPQITAIDVQQRRAEIVGVFADYASAEKAWRAAAQRTVDDAEMKFVVVHLHRLLQPGGGVAA